MATGSRNTGRGVRVPQQARSRRTRERILLAATACFEEHGYDETTTAAIAQRAGIAVGSVYDYFQDKRAILLELMHGTVEVVADTVVQRLDPEAWRSGDPRESVRNLVQQVFNARELQPGVQRILWERFFKDPEFRQVMEAIEHRVRGAMEALMRELRAEGIVRAELEDVTTTTWVVQLAIEWISSRLVLGDESVSIDAAVDAASDMVSRFLFDEVGKSESGR